MDKYQTSYALP